jgi:colanic acid biosynthesis glycosyl transferase WcaI
VANVLFLSLVFPPDSVSTAEIMGDLAVDLHGRGDRVVVVTTTPHYNRDPEAEARQPMRPVWGRLLQRSDYHGVVVYHVAMPAKGRSIVERVAAWAGFHLVSTIAGIVLVPRPDVILAPSPPLSIGLSAWIVGLFRRARYVYNVQEIYPDIAVNLGALRNRTAIRLLAAMERFIYRKAAAVTVIADRMRQRLVEKGVPPAKVLVIPNFVDADRLVPSERRNEFSRRFGLDDVFTVTYAGNLGPAQGLDVIIEAAAVFDRRDAVRFVLIGDGILRERLIASAAALPSQNALVLPYQANALMGQIYAASDVSVVPQARATGSDAIPSKVYRIMAAGRPIIAITEAGSDLAKLIAAAGCGAVVEPGDPAGLAAAVRRALAQPDWRRAAAERGRAHVCAYYSRHVIGGTYAALIDRLGSATNAA